MGAFTWLLCVVFSVLLVAPCWGDIRDLGNGEDQFLPYGVDEGDVLLALDDDGVQQFDLQPGFKFSGRYRTRLFVSNNGLISFGRGVRSYRQIDFPLCNRQPVVAAFWADIGPIQVSTTDQEDPDYTGGGVFYREIGVSDVQHMSTLTALVHDQYGSEVEDFQAVRAIVITWRRAPAFGHPSDRNTFQLVLVTNGRYSFVVWNFADLQWTQATSGADHAVVGFNGKGCRGVTHSDTISSTTSGDLDDLREATLVRRVDGIYDVEDGGCNMEGVLETTPKQSTPFGGEVVTITGPCFSDDDDIVVQFNDAVSECETVTLFDGERDFVYGARCTVPITMLLGRITIRMSLDGGETFPFRGKFNLVNEGSIEHYVASDDLANSADPVSISWDPSLFAPYGRRVRVFLVCFTENSDKSYSPLYIDLLRNVQNTGSATLSWRLPEARLDELSLCRAGIIAVQPESDSRVVPVAYSQVHVLEWYRVSVVKEMAVQSLEGHRRKRSAPNLEEALQNLFETVEEELERELRESFENLEDLLQEYAIENIIIMLNESQFFEYVVEVAFPNECDAFLEAAILERETFSNPPPVPCLRGQALEDGQFSVNNVYQSISELAQRLHGEEVEDCFISSPFGEGASNQACYDGINHLVDVELPQQSRGGSVLYAHPSGSYGYDREEDVLVADRQYLVPYFYHDLIPLYECCVLDGDCYGYYIERPFDDCSEYPVPEDAGGWGDPHISTLDGLGYMFNGLGEYTMLELDDESFTLQGRAVLASNSRTGEPVKATVWRAFAMTTPTSDVIQIEADDMVTFDILIDDDIMLELDVNYTFPFYGGVISRPEENVTFVNFTIGVSIKVIYVEGSLQILTIVPGSFRGRTRGLLGTFDGDQENDFTSSTGYIVSNNATEEDIYYQFGQTWTTTEDNSLFTYFGYESYGDYQYPDFIPEFTTPPIEPDEMAFIEELCEGDLQCIFDYVMTGNEIIAEGSKNMSREVLEVNLHLEFVASCGFLSVPAHGSADSRGYLVGDVVTVTCDEGYTLHGDHTRECLDNGQWTGQPAVCESNTSVLVLSNVTTGITVFVLTSLVFMVYTYIAHRKRSRNNRLKNIQLDATTVTMKPPSYSVS